MLALWSPKGGQGTTVVACAVALASAGADRDQVTLCDLGGDAESVLGVSASSGSGVLDWLGSRADGPQLGRTAAPVADSLRLIPRGGGVAVGDSVSSARLDRLLDELRSMPGRVVVDAGTPMAPGVGRTIVDGADESVVVMRACYLSLRRFAGAGLAADAIVHVREPQRALTAGDIEAALGLPVIATVEWDPAIARAVDAGLFVQRAPRRLRRSLASLSDDPRLAERSMQRTARAGVPAPWAP